MLSQAAWMPSRGRQSGQGPPVQRCLCVITDGLSVLWGAACVCVCVQGNQTFAVLVAGSNTYSNYRHQVGGTGWLSSPW